MQWWTAVSMARAASTPCGRQGGRAVPEGSAGPDTYSSLDEGDGSRGGTRHSAAPNHLRNAEADGAGGEPAGNGAHRAPAGRPWLQRGDRQPALVPGDDRGALRRWLGFRT